MSRMRLQADLREFIEFLNAESVSYVIAGGYAVGYHGHPRTTADIDIVVEPSPENARRVVSALRRFGFTSPDLSASTFSVPERFVQLGVQPNRIDLLTSISDVSFAEAWNTRVDDDLDGTPTHFLGKDALLRTKRAAGRPKDLADIAALTDND